MLNIKLLLCLAGSFAYEFSKKLIKDEDMEFVAI